jgi:hypothetical protein
MRKRQRGRHVINIPNRPEHRQRQTKRESEKSEDVERWGTTRESQGRREKRDNERAREGERRGTTREPGKEKEREEGKQTGNGKREMGRRERTRTDYAVLFEI